MKLICGLEAARMAVPAGALRVNLFGQPHGRRLGAGDAAAREILKQKLLPNQRAWDFLSIALSALTADFAVSRKTSPDGWTREIELEVAVREPGFWNAIAPDLVAALSFLTTDRWSLAFRSGGASVSRPSKILVPNASSVALLSGGLDSLIGAIDLTARGETPYFVSQVVRGDSAKQSAFAAATGGAGRHIQLNHNVRPVRDEGSERSRSLIFLAFGVVIATSLRQYQNGERMTLFASENGLIALNPPLTDLRVGSLSTRTAHPEFIRRLQKVLDAAGLAVDIRNPYHERTKGEMMLECADQATLRRFASTTTSCGRFQRYGYNHCGRCIPCQVRRAAFLKWRKPDATTYEFEELGRDDSNHAGFDDVRSVAMALAQVRTDGDASWGGSAISAVTLPNAPQLREVARRGLAELGLLHRKYDVK